MAEQLTTGATIFRKKRGQAEWLVVKFGSKTPGELIKGPVRRGESSVGAILRILREEQGMSVEVLEESGRISSSQKVIYYLIEQSAPADKQRITHQEKWGQYSQIVRVLGSEKERKILQQAKDVLKELSKKKS
ncbi:MAG: NUDIX domain-containing protein [Candidatus Blackburnbacteria bacterium]|nr:NUDIX domain-containing protein [Candidatus Blackburnbacteria bacterium]